MYVVVQRLTTRPFTQGNMGDHIERRIDKDERQPNKPIDGHHHTFKVPLAFRGLSRNVLIQLWSSRRNSNPATLLNLQAY